MNIIVFLLRMDLCAICWIYVNHYKHIISNWMLFILITLTINYRGIIINYSFYKGLRIVISTTTTVVLKTKKAIQISKLDNSCLGSDSCKAFINKYITHTIPSTATTMRSVHQSLKNQSCWTNIRYLWATLYYTWSQGKSRILVLWRGGSTWGYGIPLRQRRGPGAHPQKIFKIRYVKALFWTLFCHEFQYFI